MSPSATEDRNGEIWSTRIQQELLALTTDNADMESTEVRSMLPPFTTIKEHSLDIAAGTCLVTVEVQIQQKGIAEEEPIISNKILFTLDASLNRNADGSVNTSKPAYPFVPPVARLLEGNDKFPKGSTIQHGNKISMDLDWTPSLHLADAIMNIGLKIKESILQGESFHPAPEDPATTKRPFSFNFSKASTSFTKAFAHKPRERNHHTRKSRPNPTSPKHVAKTPGDVRMGDEINLLEEPWVSAHGVYSCKAIRRPIFIEEAMANIIKKDDSQQQPFTSPSAMLRSFAQSARSVMEESFLMVTETHIIELKASRLNVSSGTVAFCIPIEMMAKLKFRRGESLSLFFKTSPNEPLVYMCPDSGDAVHQIQSALKRHGVRGKHTNAAAYRAISEAMHLVQAIQTKELALKHDLMVERVNEIMDLYR